LLHGVGVKMAYKVQFYLTTCYASDSFVFDKTKDSVEKFDTYEAAVDRIEYYTNLGHLSNRVVYKIDKIFHPTVQNDKA
jgi:hypothetical protein